MYGINVVPISTSYDWTYGRKLTETASIRYIGTVWFSGHEGVVTIQWQISQMRAFTRIIRGYSDYDIQYSKFIESLSVYSLSKLMVVNLYYGSNKIKYHNELIYIHMDLLN